MRSSSRPASPTATSTAPGAAELSGRGLYYGSAATEAADCVDTDVYIVGGANSAGQAAVFFSRVAKSVTLVVRGPDLARSMSHYLIEQLGGAGQRGAPAGHRARAVRTATTTWRP